MSVELIYFVHGTTIDNEQHLATGQAHTKLSELGVKQSKELINQIEDNFDAIFVSDLPRSINSAKLTFGEDRELIIDERIRECDYGDFNQKPKDWELKDFITTDYPNGESYLDVEVRIKDFLEFLKENYGNKRVALVCHQAPQLAIEVILDNKSWEEVIDNDWRKTKAWQPGWKYIIK
jgi:broad specificity phosphatase PhoE